MTMFSSPYSPETIQEMYLDYVNNYLTVEVFAEHYNIRVQTAHFIINAGRKANGGAIGSDYATQVWKEYHND
tara:strand:- start:1108 stop:1323 length:216 start_codon:yes stop_codon:yes gene_type:complete